MATRSSVRPSTVSLARTAVSPTHFSSLDLDGLALDVAVEHYLDWVEGRGAARSRRRTQGIPQPLPRTELTGPTGGTVAGRNGAEIAARRGPGTFALRFVHRDDQHPEVHWFSVVRLTVVSPEQGASHAVRVEHASGRSLPPFKQLPPTAGAPAVLARLLEVPGVQPRQRDMMTRSVIHVERGHSERFVNYILLDEKRTLPVLLISPSKADRRFLVNPAELARLLTTQVMVATIDVDETWDFAEAFQHKGFQRSVGTCFDGAVRLFHPRISVGQSPREHYLWLSERLREQGDRATDRLAGEVAERVTWRALPPRFFSVLEDTDRADARNRAQNALSITVANITNLGDKVESLESLVNRLRQQLQESQSDLQVWESEASAYEAQLADSHKRVETLEQERDEARAEAAALQGRVAAMEARGTGLSRTELATLRDLAAGQVGSLAKALVLLQLLFQDRVALLPTAWTSAEDSASFRKPEKAWELLLRLATTYFEAVQKGGDAEARKCFSDATFASRESETVESRKGARERRTFQYKGKELTMWKHLKIGVNPSAVETWRCHFDFDAEDRRIVIGHCGKHLDFK